MKGRKVFGCIFALVLSLGIVLPGMALADSIAPSSYSATIPVGGIATLSKTVTITEQSTAPVDVFFLMDTTGSMSGTLSSVTSGFAGIVTSISALSSNVHFGVGNYNDCRDGTGDCAAGALGLAYTKNQDLTGNTAAVQTALGSLGASGGGDGPESNLYGLYGVATQTSWRTDSQRLLFWSGDINGWDPRNGVTEAIATDALVDANVKTYAMSVGSYGLDSNAWGGNAGQATRITAATGGEVITGGYSEVADLIEAALEEELNEYSIVTLDVVGLDAGVDVTWEPLSYTGDWDRSIARDFIFDVAFEGLAPGTYNFELVARLDGSIIAREADTITVTGGPVPEPASLLLLGFGLFGLALKKKIK